jgi:phage terminase small subunit
MTELTDRERLFVTEYLVELNAGQAAMRAGYGNGDIAPACVQGHRLRRRKHVAEAIAAAVAERSGATRSRMVEEIGKLAFVEVGGAEIRIDVVSVPLARASAAGAEDAA